MQLLVRRPDTGYLDSVLWVPKTYVNVEGTKRALTFQFFEKQKVVLLSLYKETEHHLLVPREFWKPSDFTFPVIDCRPRRYERVTIHSRIQLDHLEENGKLVPTGKTVQREAMEALLQARGGILQLACVSGSTVLNLNRAGKGFSMTVAEAYKRQQVDPSSRGRKWAANIQTYTRALLGDRVGLQLVHSILSHGTKFTYELILANGKTLRVTRDHEILTAQGFRSIDTGLHVGNLVACDSGQEKWGKTSTRTDSPKITYKRLNWYKVHPFAYMNGTKTGKTQTWTLEEHRAVAEARLNGLTLEAFRARCRTGQIEGLAFIDPAVWHVHHKDKNPKNNHPDNLEVLSIVDHRAKHPADVRDFGYGKVEESRLIGIREYGFEDVYDVVCYDPHHNFVANGIIVHNCGAGKTTVALDFISRRAVPALIVLDTTQLMKQWRDAIELFLDVPGGVGLIQGGSYDWKKSIVLATYHTLASRAVDMPEEVRRWFGTIVWDEIHHISAPTFSRSADLFYGMRLGLTATPDRDDGMHVVCNSHIGPVLYKNLTQELKPRFYFIWTGFGIDKNDPVIRRATEDCNGEMHVGKIASFLGSWQPRIDFVLNQVRQAVAEHRKVIVLSKSVDSLINMLTTWNNQQHNGLISSIPFPLAQDVGEVVPPNELSDATIAKLMKKLHITQANILKHPANLQAELQTKANIELAFEGHRVFKKCESLWNKKRKEYLEQLLLQPSTAGLMIYKVDPDTRTRLLREKQVTFAIAKYGREGLDERSLDTIIVNEPLSSHNALQQLMGRALRKKGGKKEPVVVFLEDDIGPFMGMCRKLRQHLIEWPSDEGGPFQYEMIGHKNTLTQRNKPSWKTTTSSTFMDKTTTVRAPGS